MRVELDPRQALRAAMVFGYAAQPDNPPETSIDLDVPVFPAGVDRIVPALSPECLCDFRQQMFASLAVLRPKVQLGNASAGRGIILLARSDNCRGRALELQPCEVAGPA